MYLNASELGLEMNSGRIFTSIYKNNIDNCYNVMHLFVLTITKQYLLAT